MLFQFDYVALDLVCVVPSHIGLLFNELAQTHGGFQHHGALGGDHTTTNGVVKSRNLGGVQRS